MTVPRAALADEVFRFSCLQSSVDHGAALAVFRPRSNRLSRAVIDCFSGMDGLVGPIHPATKLRLLLGPR